MRIELIRNDKKTSCVIGDFRVLSDDGSELFKCYCLEEDLEGVESGKDLRIPEGTYKLRRHTPSRFEATLRSITNNSNDTMINVYNDNVPARRAILIHWGNTDKDTLGCLLLGYGKGNNNITDSRNACKDFYNLVRGENLENIELVIKNEL